MGIHGDIQKLEDKGELFRNGQLPKLTGVPFLALADEKDPDAECNKIDIHLSLTGWLRSGFTAKSGADDEKQQHEQRIDMDSDDEDGDGRVASVYSIHDIYQRLAAFIKRYFFCTERVARFWVVADKGGRIPPEKERTAKKRSSRSEPYPETVTLTDEGLLDRADRRTGGIQIHRLMVTRRLREPLYLKLRQLCQQDKTLMNKHVVWDIDLKPPVEIFQGEEIQRVEWDYPKVGEDDILIPLHADPGRQHVVLSSDRDMKCILLRQRHKFKHGCFLQYGADSRYVDILLFAKQLEKDGWTVDGYIDACTFCGHDYFYKKWLLHNIGVRLIFQAVRAMLDADSKRSDVHTKEDFVLFLRLVYSYKLGVRDRICTMDEVRDIVDDKAKSQLLVPSQAVIDYAFAFFTWSTDYWGSLQSTVYKPRIASVANIIPPQGLPK
jgi:hypothetical protein